MKKILTTLFFLSTFFLVNAGHNAGGEITIKQLDYLEYEGTIHTYTRASAVPADRDSLQICWGDGTCEWIQRDTSFLFCNDRKHNIYKGINQYNFIGVYVVSMTDPNRTNNLFNLFLSDNTPFHIQTEFSASDFTNSTPLLLNPPLDVGYVGSKFQHNPAAIDWDGDSLSYELQTPMQSLNTLVPNFLLPNSVDNQGDLTIHPEFGTIIWDSPTMAGEYVIALKITEWRNNVIISQTIRDFDFTIRENANANPIISVPFDIVTLEIGDTLSFETIGSDPENGEILIQGFGLPLLVDNPASYPLPIDFELAPISTPFYWEILPNHGDINPYYLVFRIEEKNSDTINCGLTSYHVLKVRISGLPTAINSLENGLSFDIFPNPIFNNSLNIKFDNNFENENSLIQFFSMEGKLLLEKQLEGNSKTESIDVAHFPRGSYFLILKLSDKIYSKKIIKL